jgi:hypothetical protein
MDVHVYRLYLGWGAYIVVCPPLPLPLPLLSPFVLSFSSLIPLASALTALNTCANNNFLSQSAAHTCGYHIYTQCRAKERERDQTMSKSAGAGAGPTGSGSIGRVVGRCVFFPFPFFLFWRERIHRLSLRLSCIPTPCYRFSFPSLLFTYNHRHV